MKKRIKIKVFGQVQGVNFRYATRDKAQELGLCGFVRNEGDGSVYIEVEGDDEILVNFISWCHEGPEWAKVVDAEKEESNELKGYKDFVIEYN